MAKEFTLVPWQQSFEKLRGKRLSGYRTGNGFDWDRSKSRKAGLVIS
jgi:Protein of unknown function (DUF3363)